MSPSNKDRPVRFYVKVALILAIWSVVIYAAYTL